MKLAVMFGALIGFAGPRVIEQTIRQELPQGFQGSEFLLDHGMIEIVVPPEGEPGARVALRSSAAQCPNDIVETRRCAPNAAVTSCKRV